MENLKEKKSEHEKRLVELHRCRNCPYHAPNHMRCAKIFKDFKQEELLNASRGFPEWCPLPLVVPITKSYDLKKEDHDREILIDEMEMREKIE